MTDYAVIDLSQAFGDVLGVVINKISGSGLPENFAGPGFDVIESATAQYGDYWDGTNFFPPPPTIADLETELIIQMQNYINSYVFSTYYISLYDTNFLDWLTRTYLLSWMQSGSATHQLAQPDGTFASITNSQVRALFVDAYTYMQKGQDAAASVYANINNSTLTTIAAVDGAWSSSVGSVTIPTTTDAFSTLFSAATALTTLQSAVTADEGTITSNTAAITSLNTAMTAANTAIAGKLGLGTTSVDTRSLVTSTSGGGFQLSSTKPASATYSVSTSSTATIGGSGTSVVVLEMCATNSATAGDWVEIGRVESDQTISLALTLQSVQIVKGPLNVTVPVGYYVRLRSFGTGTHAEAFIEGQKTIYG